jgi:uncharacterized protein YjiS (DUF1127 family)
MHELARSPSPRREIVGRIAHLARLAGRMAALTAEALVRHYETRRHIRQLRCFDERMLRDIGLRREDIERVVRGGRD